MRIAKIVKPCILLFIGLAIQAAEPLKTIEDKTQGTSKIDGYFPLYWDESAGVLYLEIPRLDKDFLYVTSLAAGLGSNDIGLDRGQLGDQAIVAFHRVGPKILLVQRNVNFRSNSPSAAERASVEDSFATSVLQGFTVAAETNKRVLVDATEFFLKDQYGAGPAMKGYKVDDKRSAIYMPATKAFPKNTEVESTLTFAKSAEDGFEAGFPSQGPASIGQGGGRAKLAQSYLFSGTVGSVAPNAQSVTLREHF